MISDDETVIEVAQVISDLSPEKKAECVALAEEIMALVSGSCHRESAALALALVTVAILSERPDDLH